MKTANSHEVVRHKGALLTVHVSSHKPGMLTKAGPLEAVGQTASHKPATRFWLYHTRSLSRGNPTLRLCQIRQALHSCLFMPGQVMPPPGGLSLQASAFVQELLLALSQMVSAQILLGYMNTLTLAPCTRHLGFRI